ncbi:MAG TPA: 30S ribosomal protein S12 methylthiotransferase RimO [Actinomycetota bacterium]|nr:30S ribosomal protein S12 methylthiotransferase RimO [Actinomycetota bacterium]
MADVAIVTLGCPKNSVDSENLAGLIARSGHRVSDTPDAADVVVVNTCGFIDPARRETVDEVLQLAELKSEGRMKALVLSGCLVARSGPELASALPEVDALVDFAAYPRIGEIVGEAADGTLTQRIFGDPGTRFDPAWWDASMQASPRIRFGRAPWSYLKIAEGCDRGCTFCAIPLMRGKFVSRPPEIIETEARQLVTQGVSELSLVSQDSVMWGRDIGAGNLSSLIGRLGSIDGLRRIRLMYLHPQGVTDELIDTICGSDVVVSYFDLSLQHVAPRVLRGMGRWGSRPRFERMIERIRALDPLAGVRATFILGFPGETDAEAREVEAFVAESGLDWIGVFTYSREEGTRSHHLPDQIDDVVARERADRIAMEAERAMERRAGAIVGHTLEVLAERRDPKTGVWTGRSHREAPEVDGEIRFTADSPLTVGDYISVTITETDGVDLVGKADSLLFFDAGRSKPN